MPDVLAIGIQYELYSSVTSKQDMQVATIPARSLIDQLPLATELFKPHSYLLY